MFMWLFIDSVTDHYQTSSISGVFGFFGNAFFPVFITNNLMLTIDFYFVLLWKYFGKQKRLFKIEKMVITDKFNCVSYKVCKTACNYLYLIVCNGSASWNKTTRNTGCTHS